MFKKLISLALSTVMLFSATGVFAAVTTDETTGMVTYTDDFEHLEITEKVTFAKDEKYSDRAASDVIGGIIHNGGMAHLVVNEGKNGSKAFKLTAGNTSNNIVHTFSPEKKYTFYDNFVLSCDVKISNHTYTNATYSPALAGNGSYCDAPLFKVLYDAGTQTNYIANNSGTKLADYDASKWYKLIVIKRSQTNATRAYLADEEGNLIAEANDDNGWGTIGIAMNKAGTGSGAEVIIDNLEARHYDVRMIAPTVVTAPSIANADDVPVDIGSTTFVVDAPLYNNSATATLTADGDTKTCTVSADPTTLFGYTISWQGSLLSNADYTLNISGMRDCSEYGKAASATYTFKTEDLSNLPVEPVNFTGATATNGAFTDGSYANASLDESFTLSFDREILSPAYGTAVNLYKTADTSKTAVAATLTMADDAKSFTLTPNAALSLGTNYTIDFAGVKTSLGGAIEGTSAVTFTTIASRAPLYLKDDLEAAATVNGSLSGSNYKTSSILDSFSSYTSVADGVGIDGSKAIKFDNTSNSGASVNIRSKSFDLDESETLFFEYKLNIKDVSVGDTAASNQAGYFTITNASTLYPGSGNAIFKFIKITNSTTGNVSYPMTDNGQSKQMTWDADEYYTVVMKITRTTQNGYVYDETGNLLLEASLSQQLNNTVKVNWGSISSNKNILNMNLDDFKVYRVQNEAFATMDSESTVSNGATGIGTTGDIKLVFNQAFAKFSPDAVDAISFYEGSTKLDATVRRTGGNEITITPAQSLNAGRTYTIKIASTLTSLSGKTYAGPAEISFTTKTIYDINAISTTLAIAPDGSISAGSKTIVLDNVGDAVANPVIVAAIYADHRLDRLIGYEVFDVNSLTEGENTLTITLTDSYTGAGSVKILVYDSLSNLEPLMKAYKITK